MVAVSLASALFAARTTYARKETVVGLLVPTEGAIRVTTPRPGIARDVSVRDGDRVAEGQPLFTVVGERGLAGGGTLDARVQALLFEQSGYLKQQIAAVEARAVMEEQRLRAEIDGLGREIDQLGEQQALQKRREDITQAQVKAGRDLFERNVLSETGLQQREEAWLAQRQASALLQQQVTTKRSELQRLRLDLEDLPQRTRERLAQLWTELSNIAQRQAEAEAQRTQVVTAPVAGRASAVQLFPGQPLETNKPALVLLPEGAELLAELFVPSRAIGFVQPGQRVRLMYDAFPFQRFGAYHGAVAHVAEAVLAPDEVVGPITPREPIYRATVRLDRQTIVAADKPVPLQPGMTLMADIVLEERSLLDWLLEPLHAFGKRM
ncbi:MAG TPA: HlyD family efflux transporter periplasmic adaptor subunit [Azospirillaceae bacterium]|nr:HlyD family efflux transporter periplasmic adaptor subunit [Azospirillaceae bacterium]